MFDKVCGGSIHRDIRQAVPYDPMYHGSRLSFDASRWACSVLRDDSCAKRKLTRLQ